jgi:hypothetical protein
MRKKKLNFIYVAVMSVLFFGVLFTAICSKTSGIPGAPLFLLWYLLSVYVLVFLLVYFVLVRKNFKPLELDDLHPGQYRVFLQRESHWDTSKRMVQLERDGDVFSLEVPEDSGASSWKEGDIIILFYNKKDAKICWAGFLLKPKPVSQTVSEE